MSKFCETSRQLCLLLLIVVVRGGCNTQSHSMSNNNNEYEWVSWLHVTFGNANIQPETKKTSSQARRRPEMEISVKNSDIALLCQKGGCRAVETTAARCRKRNAFFLLASSLLLLLVYIHKCLLFNFLGCLRLVE